VSLSCRRVFGWLLWWSGVQGLTVVVDRILHFTTFVIACVETSKRNRGDNVVYVTGPPQYGYGQTGQTVPYTPAPPAQVYQNGGMKAERRKS
jgi:hypothetical protein